MDPGHHTAFLLAIFICILLLVLAVSALLMCFWRSNNLKCNRTLSTRFGRLVRDQATSMTSFTLNTLNPKFYLQNDPKQSQAITLPISVDKHVMSHLTLNSHVMSVSDEEEETQTSTVNKPLRKKSGASSRSSTLQHMLSSGASFFGNVLEKSSMFSIKAKRRSSSLKSGVDLDITMIPLESPVHVSAMHTNQFQPACSPSQLSRSSTLLCENSTDQQFTWDTAGFSILSKHGRHNKESFSLPNTLGRKTVEDSAKQNAQLGKPESFQPKAWFVYMGNRPLSEGAQLENELNNVTSLDSGVDIVDPVVKNGYGDLRVPQRPMSTNDPECRDLGKSSNENYEENVDDEKPDGCIKLQISHQEAARKLNPNYYSRSLWEKREERPLIGVN